MHRISAYTIHIIVAMMFFISTSISYAQDDNIPKQISKDSIAVDSAIRKLNGRCPIKIRKTILITDFDIVEDTIKIYAESRTRRPDYKLIIKNIKNFRKLALQLVLQGQTNLSVAKMISKERYWHKLYINYPLKNKTDEITISPDEFHEILTKVDKQTKIKKGIDTTYIEKPVQAWRLTAYRNFYGSDFLFKAKNETDNLKVNLHANVSTTWSASVAMRNMSVSISIDPIGWFGKSSDFEFDFSSHNNQYGFDFIYSYTGKYTGDYTFNGDKYKTEALEADLSQKMLILNGYYCFNYKHFSYPAAFSQSEIQKRSSGSFLVGTTIMRNKVRIESEDAPFSMIFRQWGLGIGYGYNLVLGKKWLIHASCIPEVVILSNNKLENDEGKKKMENKFPNWIINGRIAAVKNYQNKFYGFNILFNNNISKFTDKSLQINKWSLNLFFGMRI